METSLLFLHQYYLIHGIRTVTLLKLQMVGRTQLHCKTLLTQKVSKKVWEPVCHKNSGLLQECKVNSTIKVLDSRVNMYSFLRKDTEAIYSSKKRSCFGTLERVHPSTLLSSFNFMFSKSSSYIMHRGTMEHNIYTGF